MDERKKQICREQALAAADVLGGLNADGIEHLTLSDLETIDWTLGQCVRQCTGSQVWCLVIEEKVLDRDIEYLRFVPKYITIEWNV